MRLGEYTNTSTIIINFLEKFLYESHCPSHTADEGPVVGLCESQLLHNVGVKSLLFFLEFSLTKWFSVARYFKNASLCLRTPLIIKSLLVNWSMICMNVMMLLLRNSVEISLMCPAV